MNANREDGKKEKVARKRKDARYTFLAHETSTTILLERRHAIPRG